MDGARHFPDRYFPDGTPNGDHKPAWSWTDEARVEDEKLLRKMLSTSKGRDLYLAGVSPEKWEQQELDRACSRVYGPGSGLGKRSAFRDQLMRGKRR